MKQIHNPFANCSIFLTTRRLKKEHDELKKIENPSYFEKQKLKEVREDMIAHGIIPE